MSPINPETQYSVGAIPFHTHNHSDSLPIDVANLINFTGSPSINGLVYWNGSSYNTIPVGTTGYFLIGQGSSAPAWGISAGAFWGNGSDGALSVSSGTTTLNLSSKQICVKNYSSVSITGTAVVNTNNPNTSGTLLVWKCQGDVTITSSANPSVDLRNAGGQGGAPAQGQAGGTEVAGNPGGGFGGWEFFQGSITGGTGGVKTGPTGGGGGKSMTSYTTIDGSAIGTTNAYLLIWPCAPGSGGGSGANDTFDSSTFSGAGGNGGGGLLILCGGNLNITSAINVAGQAGGNTSQGNNCAGGGGGGGGVTIIYKGSLIANSATVTTTGGSGGTAFSGGAQNGSSGANGQFVVCQNKVF